MNEWRRIDGIVDYEFSFEGREAKCRNLNYRGTGQIRILNAKPNCQGRLLWRFKYNGEKVSWQAARWIALAFPELVENEYFEGADIDHIDTDPMNNHPSNLRWVTRSGNLQNPLTKQHNSAVRKGRVFSLETRRKMSESRKGKACPFKGKHLSEEHKRKISESMKNRHKEQ